jgi:hypothetical protein
MNFYELNEIMQASYTAIVLDIKDRARLLSFFPPPAGWESLAHHMTINMGGAAKGPAKDLIGTKADLTINSIARNELVIAVGVESNIPSVNQRKHITIAVNRSAGGKPVMSNHLAEWEPIDPLAVTGTVAEVAQDGKILR